MIKLIKSIATTYFYFNEETLTLTEALPQINSVFHCDIYERVSENKF